jgi:hypothetical protein
MNRHSLLQKGKDARVQFGENTWAFADFATIILLVPKPSCPWGQECLPPILLSLAAPSISGKDCHQFLDHSRQHAPRGEDLNRDISREYRFD